MALPTPTASNRAVVTGASSGIGMELARELARRGWSLILVARREEILQDLAEELRTRDGVTVEVRACDLSDTAATNALSAELASREIGILCNNAGVATFGAFKDLDPDYERALVRLNAVAVHELILAVLPGMIERRAGGILNVGSAAGNMAIPNNATYAASKAFVNSFSESLRGELKGTGVHVTLLAPGPVRTDAPLPEDIAGVADKIPGFVWSSSADAARMTLDALARNRQRVVPGLISKGMSLAGTYVPRRITGPIAGAFYKKLGDG